MRELLLRVDLAVLDQPQNLPLPVGLVHPMSFNRTSAASRAPATADGAVPPDRARVFIPSTGESSAAIPGVNSGANWASDSAVQSPGRFPACTLSNTRRPTILCA